MELFSGIEESLSSARGLLQRSGVAESDIVQADTVCYRVESDQRYDQVKQLLAEQALLRNETPINGRLIAVFELRAPLASGDISYVELPQPKPGSDYQEGIEHIQFVTRQGLSHFRESYSSIDFDTKGLTSPLNPLLRLVGDDITVKFHDKHMGSVLELESQHQA